MKDKLKKIEMFFAYDLKVKELMVKMDEILRYGANPQYFAESQQEFFKALEEIKYYLYMMVKEFNNFFLKSFEEFFAKIDEKLIASSGTIESLRTAYSHYVWGMRPEFIKSVGESYSRYSLFSGSGVLSPESLNEYLHDLHTDVVNRDTLFNNFTEIEYENKRVARVFGVENPIAVSIAETISKMDSFSINVDDIKILSLSNRILMMARDLGHATSIEIEFEEDQAFVKYFIPKVINYLMVNELPGITKVGPHAKYARGEFRVPISSLCEDLSKFLYMLPTDKDWLEIYDFESVEEMSGKAI